MKSKKLAHLSAIVVMIIWGLSYLSIKVVVQEINPITSAFYRFIIASVILFSILKLKYPQERILRSDYIKMAVGGFFGVTLYFFFENYAVDFTSASNVAILLSSIPVFTLIAQSIVFKEKMTAGKILGAVLSAVGIIIIVTSKEKVSLFSKGTIGDLMALGSALCWVIYNMINSSFKGKYKSITITTYQSLWGTLFLAPSLFLEPFKLPSLSAGLNLVFLAVLCSCAGYVLYMFSLANLGATVLTTYINLQPIVSLVAAFFLIGERMTAWNTLGSLIIIAGVFLVSFAEKNSKEAIQEVA